MKTTDRQFLADYKHRAESALPGRIVRMVLFGSRARGDAGQESDWDVAVYLDGGPAPGERGKLADAAWDVLMETERFIQPVVLDAATMDADLMLQRNIRAEGVAL